MGAGGVLPELQPSGPGLLPPFGRGQPLLVYSHTMVLKLCVTFALLLVFPSAFPMPSIYPNFCIY